MSINVPEIAELLGLDLVSANIYIELLVHGRLSKTEVVSLISEKDEKVNAGIEMLIEKGFASIITNGENQEVLEVVRIRHLEEKLDRDKTILNNLKNFVVPQIRPPEKLSIMKYEGWQGLRRAYSELLEEAIRLETNIYAFEANDINNEGLGETFLKNYVESRISKKVHAYVLCPRNAEDEEYKEQFESEFTHIKLVDDFPLEAIVNVVGNLVMTFSNNPPQGTLRRSEAEANTWRAIFDFMWQRND